jgi:hypothetical protein
MCVKFPFNVSSEQTKLETLHSSLRTKTVAFIFDFLHCSSVELVTSVAVILKSVTKKDGEHYSDINMGCSRISSDQNRYFTLQILLR